MPDSPQRRVALKVAVGFLLVTLLLTLCNNAPYLQNISRVYLSRRLNGTTAEDKLVCPQEDGLVHHLAYISHPPSAERLGCPLNHTFACFYSFQANAMPINGQDSGTYVKAEDCIAFYEPIPADHGRGWCVRLGSEPLWLEESLPQAQRHSVSGSVLLTGKLDSPNPTHQANLHFHAIWLWMKRQNLQPGELQMLVDFPDKSWSPGTYGTGMASALGRIEWLPSLQEGFYHFQKIQFSIPGGAFFPFDLKRQMVDAPIDLDFLELAENIKLRLHCVPDELMQSSNNMPKRHGKDDELMLPSQSVVRLREEDRPPRIILAKRTKPHTRVWTNVEEVANELRSGYGMRVEVVSMGELSFPMQVSTVSSADVLVGITGSDLVNLMFLPSKGSIIEIFPSVDHQGVFIPELSNMAKMLGKNHFAFVSDGNITLDDGEERLLYRTRFISVDVTNIAALVHLAAQTSLHGTSLSHTGCIYNHSIARCAVTGD